MDVFLSPLVLPRPSLLRLRQHDERVEQRRRRRLAARQLEVPLHAQHLGGGGGAPATATAATRQARRGRRRRQQEVRAGKHAAQTAAL